MKTAILIGTLFVTLAAQAESRPASKGADYITARKPFLNGVRASRGTVAGDMAVAFGGGAVSSPEPRQPTPRIARAAAPAPEARLNAPPPSIAPGTQILSLDGLGLKNCGAGRFVGPGEGC